MFIKIHPFFIQRSQVGVVHVDQFVHLDSAVLFVHSFNGALLGDHDFGADAALGGRLLRVVHG